MMNKEMSWVPVLENIPEEVLSGDSNNYIPTQYETKDLYQVKESFENKSLKWWMSLSMDQQVTIGFKYDEPTFNLTIRAIMFEYEQSLKNK